MSSVEKLLTHILIYSLGDHNIFNIECYSVSMLGRFAEIEDFRQYRRIGSASGPSLSFVSSNGHNFDSFEVTGATTYQNEALSMFYVSNVSNCHGSVLCAE